MNKKKDKEMNKIHNTDELIYLWEQKEREPVKRPWAPKV